MTEQIDWGKVRHFTPQEWRKDPGRVNPNLVYKLDLVRFIAGVPAFIHVAFEKGGHSRASQHYLGNAVDFHFDPKWQDYARQLYLLEAHGFTGIGFYPQWKPCPGWHVDIREASQVLYWYQENSVYNYGRERLIKKISSM